jgi:hypothetical protein
MHLVEDGYGVDHSPFCFFAGGEVVVFPVVYEDETTAVLAKLVLELLEMVLGLEIVRSLDKNDHLERLQCRYPSSLQEEQLRTLQSL